jgi:hypothetical protein
VRDWLLSQSKGDISRGIARVSHGCVLLKTLSRVLDHQDACTRRFRQQQQSAMSTPAMNVCCFTG